MTNMNFTTKRMLPVAEWMAENAYIPPGMHRLLAAGGLAVGLWGGRSFMDIVVARNHDDGSQIKRAHVPQLFRPLHGVMSYNPYSDNASDRWKGVVDKFVPAVTGGMMAYYGGKYFFHGKGFSLLDKAEKPLHALTDTAKKNISAEKISLQTAEQLGSMHQADAMRRLSAGTYGAGATIGTDKLGGLFMGNHNNWADSFAIGAGIKPRIPGWRWLNEKVLGNYSLGSLSTGRAMRNAAKWVEGNLHTQADLAWATTEQLRIVAKNALQSFPHATEAEIENVASHMRGVIEEAYSAITPMKSAGKLTNEQHTQVQKIIAGNLNKGGLLDQGFDRLLHSAGIDLGKAHISDHGLMSIYSRGLGSAKNEQASRKAYAEYVKTHFGATFDATLPELSHKEKLTLWGSMAGAVATVTGLGSVAASHINKRAAKVQDENGNEEIVTNSYDPPTKEKSDNLVKWVNGTPLNMMEWASRMVIVPPSMHRLMSAAYLSATLYGGMKLADVMTGRKLPLLRSGELFKSELAKESLTGAMKLLKPLHGIIEYTPGSSLAKDRWRLAAHYLIPVGFGAFGTYTGSALYFKDRAKKLETPTNLEDYTDKIAYEQSKPFAGLTAVTSIFNTGSGIHLIPFFNYSSNLQSRYVMGGGLQVATPGLGKWWSGNAGLTPWGVKKTLAYIGNYLGHNSEARPRELPALVHSVLAKLYPDMPETELLLKKREFLHAIHEVRDTYIVDHKLPVEKQDDFAKHMKELVTGQGFESLLLAAGFDPAKANLASNGVSGTIANAMGKAGETRHLQEEYREKFTERLNADRKDPRAYLKHLANSPAEAIPSANDNIVAANDNPTAKVVTGSHDGRIHPITPSPMRHA